MTHSLTKLFAQNNSQNFPYCISFVVNVLPVKVDKRINLLQLTFRRSRIYQSCQIVEVFFNKKRTMLDATMKFVTQEDTFGPLIFDKFKRDVIFEVIVIDTMKPTGQCILEDFRTLIISFDSVNSIMKNRPARIKGQGLSAGADSRPPNIANSLSLFQKQLVLVKR